MNKIDKYLFETFATMHPIEAYDEYPDEFCAFMREKVGNHMTDADISAFVEEQRKNLPIEVDGTGQEEIRNETRKNTHVSVQECLRKSALC